MSNIDDLDVVGFFHDHSFKIDLNEAADTAQEFDEIDDVVPGIIVAQLIRELGNSFKDAKCNPFEIKKRDILNTECFNDYIGFNPTEEEIFVRAVIENIACCTAETIILELLGIESMLKTIDDSGLDEKVSTATGVLQTKVRDALFRVMGVQA